MCVCVRGSRCCASKRCLNMCGSVYRSAGESAYGLLVECVGVFAVLKLVLCFFDIQHGNCFHVDREEQRQRRCATMNKKEYHVCQE